MENQKKKCSSKKHSEIDAINYCQECKINLCNKCRNYHSELFETHHLYNIDKNINEIFTGYCKEEGHKNLLRYYCKYHNKLCCGDCVVKIEGKEYGQHKDCDKCFIKEIKDIKKKILKENNQYLEDFKFEYSTSDLEILFDKINKNKETLMQNIQKIFTKIRNVLNEREDEILLEVNNQFNNFYINEDLIEKSKVLSNRIKITLEKGKSLDKEWNENEINCYINDCIEIENNIKDINIINEIILKRISNQNNEIKFSPDEDGINNILEIIKTFGEIYNNKYTFKNLPLFIRANRMYEISGVKMNILTKTGIEDTMGTICENKLAKLTEHIWKIKILKSKKNNIMVGVAPIDFDINSSSYDNCGWYFHCGNLKLYSGPPHYYSGIKSNLSKVNDEIIIVMNMNKRTLKFIINNEDKGESYTDIPIDKPLSPAVFLYHLNDSVEILEY